MLKMLNILKRYIVNLILNKNLILALVKREIISRYKGSVLGIFWTFITPLFMLTVYSFVFGDVLKVKWQSGADNDPAGQFALLLFVGLMVFNFFSECLTRAPTQIINNVNFVKKVIFPLEVLPLVLVLSSFFNFIISYIVWLIGYVAFFGIPSLTILLAPLVLMPFVVLTLGICMFLSALGVFVRDINHIIGLVCTALMFLSPIFYPKTSLPEKYQSIVNFNPITLPMDFLRDVSFWGESIVLENFTIYSVISFVVLLLGVIFFQTTRKAFADVI